jgi:hypothetical protein
MSLTFLKGGKLCQVFESALALNWNTKTFTVSLICGFVQTVRLEIN